MSQEHASAIDSTMREHRLFAPPKDFAAKAHIKSREEYDRIYRDSIADPDSFWAKIASELHWFTKWDSVLEWKNPYARWFVGGKTNLAYNCLDRQIELGRGDKVALLWEGEPELEIGKGGEIRRITYQQLRDDVGRLANGLKNLGVEKGDRVTIYMPMIPEAVVAMLACARIGAPHSVIFGGFSAQAIADRVEDAKSEIIITADGGWRRGAPVPLKKNVDEALTKTDLVKTVVVFERTGSPVEMVAERDVAWSELVANQSTDCPAEPMD